MGNGTKEILLYRQHTLGGSAARIAIPRLLQLQQLRRIWLDWEPWYKSVARYSLYTAQPLVYATLVCGCRSIIAICS